MSKNVFWAQMPKYGYLAPDPQNLDILGNFLYDSNHLDNTLQMSPQPLSGDKLKPNYVQKGVCGPECPNMVIRPQTPKFENFLYALNHLINTLPMSPEPISGDNFTPSYHHFSNI